MVKRMWRTHLIPVFTIIASPFKLRTAINNYYSESKSLMSLMSSIFEPLFI